jgi:hypothetical protein
MNIHNSITHTNQRLETTQLYIKQTSKLVTYMQWGIIHPQKNEILILPKYSWTLKSIMVSEINKAWKIYGLLH